MEWDDLQTFLAIAKEGTLSGAARVLNTTQPTMGRRLQKMEERLGARLLERHPRGYVLTNLGETILGTAERIEAEVINAERVISGRDTALEGVVRVTSVDVITSRILPPAILKIQELHPKIQIELMPDARTLNLSRREADIAIRLTRFENLDIITKKLGTLSAGVFASQEYLDKYGMPNKSNSENHRIINVLDDYMHLPEAKAIIDALPNATTVLKTNSRETMTGAVLAGIGIAILPKHSNFNAPNLINIDIGIGTLEREVWLGVHRDLRHMPRVRAVINAISEEFATCPKKKE